MGFSACPHAHFTPGALPMPAACSLSDHDPPWAARRVAGAAASSATLGSYLTPSWRLLPDGMSAKARVGQVKGTQSAWSGVVKGTLR